MLHAQLCAKSRVQVALTANSTPRLQLTIINGLAIELKGGGARAPCAPLDPPLYIGTIHSLVAFLQPASGCIQG